MPPPSQVSVSAAVQNTAPTKPITAAATGTEQERSVRAWRDLVVLGDRDGQHQWSGGQQRADDAEEEDEGEPAQRHHPQGAEGDQGTELDHHVPVGSHKGILCVRTAVGKWHGGHSAAAWRSRLQDHLTNQGQVLTEFA